MPFYDNLFGDPFGSAALQSPGQPAPPLPQLSPQDEEGILARLGRGALGGLGYIGGSLDKGFGGRAIRGVLGGHPEELLSLIPFSDTLGITNEANAVSGRQLAGYRPEDDSWGATLGGMGTEMLLDPATYLTFGGKTLLGKTAEKLGALPKAVAPTTTRITNNPFARRFTGQLSTEMRGLSPASDEAAKLAAGIGLPGNVAGPVSAAQVSNVSNQPLSALATLSVPFGGELGSIPLGTGKFAQGVADVASNAKDWLTYSRAGRAVTPLFDSRLSEFGAPGSTEAVQRNTRAQADLLAGKTPEILGQHVAERNVVAGAGFDMTDPAQAADLNVRLRQYLEGQQPAVAGVHTPLPSGVEDMAVGQLQELLARREGAAAVGRTAGRMSDDFTGYFPRGKTRASDDVFNDPALRQVLAPHNPNDIRRLDPLTEIPLGTAGGINPLLPPEAMPIGGINELFTDPFTKAVPGLPGSIEKRAMYTRRKYLQMTKADEQEYANLLLASKVPSTHLGPVLTPQQTERLAELQAKVTQSEQLVGMSSSDIEKAYQGGLAKATAAGQTPIQFARQTRKDMTAGFAPFQNSPLADIQNYRLADEKSNAAARVVMDTLAQNAVAGGGEGMVKVKDALTASGYGNKNARKLLGKSTLNSYIPQDIAADLTRRDTSPFTVPSVLKPVLGLADSVTNLNKAFQTKFFPSTIGRNFGGEQYVNILGKAGNPIENTLDAMHVRAGQGLESLADLRNPGVSPFANMTADEALRHYDELAFQHGVQKPFTRAAWDDIIGAPAMDTGAPGTLAPIGERGNIIQAAKDAWANTVTGAQDMRQSLSKPGGFNPLNWEWGGDNALNPIGMAGVGGRGETTNAIGFLGEQAMQAADQVGKHGAFLGFLKQGFAPEVAAQKAIELRMGGRKLAPFENQVMRRLVPYYCVPEHSEILTREGWKKHDALIVGEEASTYNIEKNCMEWQPVEAKHVFDHDQELMVWKNSRYKLEFTADHRWIVKLQKTRFERDGKTYVYPERIRVIEGHRLAGGQSIVCAAGYHGAEESELTVEQARLVGWIVTDGTVRRRRGFVEVTVYQHPSKFLKEVVSATGGRPRKPMPNGVVAVGVPTTLVKPIEKWLHREKLPSLVCRLSRPAMEAMYEAMYQAEGSKTHPNSKFFAQQCPHVRDAFRILAAMLGKRTSRGLNGCYVSENRYLNVRSQNASIGFEHYKGRVWCPQTKNGTWLMRQNGMITITGNSWSAHNIPQMAGSLATEPGGLVGTSIRGTNAVRQNEGIMPDWLGEGIAAPIGSRDEQGNQRYLTSLGLPFEDLSKVASSGPNAGERVLQKLLANLNPLIKNPIEAATGKQLYSGRDLEDLYSRSGLGPAGEELLGMTPLSRPLNIASTLLDPRKGPLGAATNVLSPGRITDVDMGRAAQIQGRRLLEDELRANPLVREHTDIYVPAEQRARMTPEELQLLSLYRTLLNRARVQGQR